MHDVSGDLFYLCRVYTEENVVKKVKELLNAVSEGQAKVDVLYNNGDCIALAFERDNPELMKLLLDHYEKYVLSKVDTNPLSGSCPELKRLTDILDYIVRDEVISAEMLEVLAYYLDEDTIDPLDKLDSSSGNLDKLYQEIKDEYQEKQWNCH